MKDNNIPYDLVHQQQHHHQQHQQQQHHQQQQQHHHHHQQQQQHHSWNRHHQQHSANIYSSQHNSHQPASQSRSAIGSQQQQPQQGQLGQYSHQQLHNNATSAYYQQAHLYPGAFQALPQQDQQQSAADHQHHHHSSGTPVTAPGTTTSALNAAAAAAAQQQHAAVHNQQQGANTQASALGHAGWSPSVGALAAQGHHTVVTDPSTLAYITHAYQSNNSSVNDHRNSSASLAHQSIGTGHQASYAVDSLYNSPAAAAAAAAVAAYGYGNYNAAFFQASNNGHHTQTGHPSATGLSAFWNPNQSAQQQRTNHSQGVTNQTSIQQRQQQIPTDQASGYMQDPRLYYGRPPYGQVMPNFGQHQPQSTQQQPQSDLAHNRMSSLAQQQLLIHHTDPQMQHFDSHQTQLSTQLATTVLGSQSQSSEPHSVNDQASTNQVISQSQQGRKVPSPIDTPPHLLKKLPSSDLESGTQKSTLDYDHVSANKNTQTAQLVRTPQQPPTKDLDSSSIQGAQSMKEPIKQTSISPVSKSQSVIKPHESSTQSQTKRPSGSNPTQQQVRNVYRASQDERQKSQPTDSQKRLLSDRDRTSSIPETKNQAQVVAANKSPESDQSSAIEDSMATLAIGSRKTTWASIASQPAKVAQPKSLKSKISGSNSVLSSAKHLASSVALDSSSLDPKNGINPAIKNSVSTAATSIARSSVPPPVSKPAVATATSLKLDLLGEEGSDPSKISWPAVNASINLTLDDPPMKKEPSLANSSHLDSSLGDRSRGRDDDIRRDRRDASSKDHNHNQGDPKLANNYHQGYREDRRDDLWGNRRDREQRDYRVRRDSDRKEVVDQDKRMNHNDMRNPNVEQRRDFRGGLRSNQFRGDEPNYRDRDFKRGAMMDRNDHRGNDDYRYQPNRYDSPRDSQPNLPSNQGGRPNENASHHHYSNLRDGTTRGPHSKLDLSLHPHLNPENYNPKNFDCEPEGARYFIIKSYSEDDIHRSIKYSIWCSTNHGNKRLDEAYRQQQNKNGPLFLLFSVNGSGHFCGMAQMTSAVDFDSSSGVWAQSKWQGEFSVKWIYVKDVPNSALRHITLENNEGKPVTNSRDTQEVPSEKGKAVLKILHQFSHTTSLFDDFLHYERRQEEEKLKKSHTDHPPVGRADDRDRGRYNNRPYTNSRLHNEFQDRPGNRERPSRYMP